MQIYERWEDMQGSWVLGSPKTKSEGLNLSSLPHLVRTAGQDRAAGCTAGGHFALLCLSPKLQSTQSNQSSRSDTPCQTSLLVLFPSTHQAHAAEVKEAERFADHSLSLDEVPQHLCGCGLHVAVILQAEEEQL